MTPARRGFSAIEIIVVVSIMALLAAIATPAVLRAAATARLSAAAEAILRVHREARQLAMTRHLAVASKLYGTVVVVPASGEAYAAILFGTSDTDILMADDDGDGQADTGPGARPLLRVPLPGSVEVHVAQGAAGVAAPFTGTLHWFYDRRTGVPLESVASTNPVSIGTRGHAVARATQFFTSVYGTNDLLALARPVVPPSPVCSELAVTARGTTTPRIRIAIYDPGLGWRSELEEP